MSRFRNRLRVVALTWLLCQAATLAAFVPDQCCTAHAERAAKDKSEACHESEPPKPDPGDACPMHQSDGAACPMHSGNSHDCCAMTNGCDGPGSQLANLFAFNAAPEPPVGVTMAWSSSVAIAVLDEVPHHRVTRPQSPPPKA